jgi:anti-sigma B factor antagonist
MESYLSVDLADRQDATVLTVSGELDMSSGPRLAAALEQVESTQRRVILDLSGVEFIDVTGLRVLLQARERARRAGVELAVVNASRGVRRLLSLTGTTELLGGVDNR